MIFIHILNFSSSLGVLFLIKKGKIVKYSRILRYVNIAQVILILFLPILFIVSIIDMYYTIFNHERTLDILMMLFYTILGAVVFMFNVIIILLNYYYKSHPR